MGEIPSHWIYTKNRFGFRKWKNGKNKSDDTSVLSLTIKGIKIKKDLSFGKSTESYIGHQLVEKGDIVFTPRDFDQTPILSDVSKYDGCISNLYIVDKTKKRVLNHYINYYWYGLKYSVDYFKNFSHGIRFSFNRFQFDEIPLLIPPLPEQSQIVSFLDTKTQKIDDLIHKTEKKIELLKEKRTSLINHCVTKGLNPNVEMKDSGVEWIGEIPNHWVLVKPWRLFKPEKRKPEYGDEIITCFRDGQVTLRKNRREGGFTNSLKEIGYQRILIGDLVVHEMDGFEGSIGVSDSIGKSTPVYTVISSSSKHNNRFWMYLLREMSNTRYIESLSKSIRERTTEFRWNTWKTQKFPNPQLTEQTQIVEYLDEQTQKIDSTIEKETQRIELLKEYRQSLISEVVTGKIDVRDEVIV